MTNYQAFVINQIREERLEEKRNGKRQFGPGYVNTYYHSGKCSQQWVPTLDGQRSKKGEDIVDFAKRIYGEGAGRLVKTEVVVGSSDPSGPNFIRVENEKGRDVYVVRAYAVVLNV